MARKRILKIALAQLAIAHGDTETNTRRALEQIDLAADQNADIICLPEVFNTGFVRTERQHALAEPVDGPYVQALSHLAREKRIYIISGYTERSHIPGQIYNSAILINDRGETIGNMRKVYLWGKEKLRFRAGNKFPVYDTPLGKIGLMICYDLEYPEPARILAMKGAELVFAPSMFSLAAARRWEVDLAGNALFNLMYVAGVNPVEENCCGASQVVGPDGVVVAAASPTEEELLLCEVNLDYIQEMRAQVPYFNDFKTDTFSMDALERY